MGEAVFSSGGQRTAARRDPSTAGRLWGLLAITAAPRRALRSHPAALLVAQSPA